MTEKEVIITQLEQAFRRKSWHGTNLLGSIRGIDAQAASWRPAPNRHNIRELIVHAAYWKYSVYRRFAVDKQSKFALKGSNWFERPASDPGHSLRSDVQFLKTWHDSLIISVNDFNGDLGMVPKGSATTLRDLAMGAAAHDVYHAGQIQLIKRLYAGPNGPLGKP